MAVSVTIHLSLLWQMIQFYRVNAFFLLVASIASLASLLARLVQGLREPAFWACLLAALGLGIAGSVAFYTRNSENKEWVYLLICIGGIALSLIVGGLIQWSR